MRQTLTCNQGADVFSANSGVNAIGPLGRMGRLPSVILCDYRLVEENGLDVIQSLRDEFNEDIAAILITGDVLIAGIHKERARVSPPVP